MGKGLKTAILSVGACAVMFLFASEIITFIQIKELLAYDIEGISIPGIMISELLYSAEILFFIYWGALTQTKTPFMIASGCMFANKISILIQDGFGIYNWYSYLVICISIAILMGMFLKNKYVIGIPFALYALYWVYCAIVNIEDIMYSPIHYSIIFLCQLSNAVLFGMLAYAVFRYDKLMCLDRPLSAYTPYTPAPATTVDTVTSRLDFLNAEYQAGRLSFEEYKQRRMEILKTLGK